MLQENEAVPNHHNEAMETMTPELSSLEIRSEEWVSEWMSSFLTAHQHNIGYTSRKEAEGRSVIRQRVEAEGAGDYIPRAQGPPDLFPADSAYFTEKTISCCPKESSLATEMKAKKEKTNIQQKRKQKCRRRKTKKNKADAKVSLTQHSQSNSKDSVKRVRSRVGEPKQRQKYFTECVTRVPKMDEGMEDGSTSQGLSQRQWTQSPKQSPRLTQALWTKQMQIASHGGSTCWNLQSFLVKLRLRRSGLSLRIVPNTAGETERRSRYISEVHWTKKWRTSCGTMENR